MDKKEKQTRSTSRKTTASGSSTRKRVLDKTREKSTTNRSSRESSAKESTARKRTTGTSSQRRNTTTTKQRDANSHLSYQRQGQQKRKKKRRKMSKTERYIHIAIRWTIFFIIVGLLLFGIGKGISAAYHLIRGDSKKTTKTIESSEATTEDLSSETKVVSNDPIEITISAVGDCTLGTDETFGYDGGFNQIYDNVQDPEYFLANVKSIFEADDLTIANLEGPLTMSVDMADKEYVFKGKPEYAKILSLGSVDVVNLANDHTMDYGEEGYNDTIEYLAQTGVKSFGTNLNTVVEVSGVKVGLLGVNATGSDLEGYENRVTSGIAELKENGAQLIIASFHWGLEQENYPTEMQKTLGHYAIDAGADLVLGHNPHVLQGIEEYNGKNIVYSLGNFCYGANASPSDMNTMIYQQTFTVTGDVVSDDLVTNIIPCRMSSSDSSNNYQPVPVEDEAKDAILANLETYSAGMNPTEESDTEESSTESGSSEEATEETSDTSESSEEVTQESTDSGETGATETSEEATFE